MIGPEISDQQRAALHGALASGGAREIVRLQTDLGLIAARCSTRRVRVMLQMTDGVSRRPFNMSEALAVEAWAAIGGHPACLLRLGDEEEAALAGAVILAAIEADPSLLPRVEAALAALGQKRAAAEARERAAVRATEINFEGGEVEAYDASDYSTDR